MKIDEAIKEVKRLNCNGRLFSNTMHEAIETVLKELEDSVKQPLNSVKEEKREIFGC